MAYVSKPIFLALSRAYTCVYGVVKCQSFVALLASYCVSQTYTPLIRVARITHTHKVRQTQVCICTCQTTPYVKERAPHRCIFIISLSADYKTENIANVKRNKLTHNTLRKKILLKKSFPKGEKVGLILMGRLGRA